MTTKNGNLAKWAGIIVTAAVILVSWIGYAKVLAYRVETNEALDAKDHAELKGMASENHDNILKMQSDISYIKTGIDEIKNEVRNKP